jgi:hypothetical protein
MACGFSKRPNLAQILSSSAVERSAVNRLVVGSNPTSGAKQLYRLARRESANPSGFESLGFEPESSGDRRSQSYLRSQDVTNWWSVTCNLNETAETLNKG